MKTIKQGLTLGLMWAMGILMINIVQTQPAFAATGSSPFSLSLTVNNTGLLSKEAVENSHSELDAQKLQVCVVSPTESILTQQIKRTSLPTPPSHGRCKQFYNVMIWL